jgi:hypothetical protein
MGKGRTTRKPPKAKRRQQAWVSGIDRSQPREYEFEHLRDVMASNDPMVPALSSRRTHDGD